MKLWNRTPRIRRTHRRQIYGKGEAAISYCRWSSDNFGCDLYVYADADGGYATHVAERRIVGEVPPLDWDLLDTDPEAFNDLHNEQLRVVGAAERVPIGGPFDGESFYDSTLIDLRARLLMLRGLGYRFPDHVLAEVGAEIEEDAARA